MSASPNSYVLDRDSQPGGIIDQAQMLLNVNEANGALTITVMYSNGTITTLIFNPTTTQGATAAAASITTLTNNQLIATPSEEPLNSTFLAGTTRLWMDEFNGYLMFKSLLVDGVTFVSGRLSMLDLVSANNSDFSLSMGDIGRAWDEAAVVS